MKMKMIFSDWATLVFLFLKFLCYASLDVEGGSDVIKALWHDAILDSCAVVLLASVRDSSEEKRQILLIPFIFLSVSPVIGGVTVQSFDRLRDDQPPEKLSPKQLVWLYLITLASIGLTLVLWKYCRRSDNAAVRSFAKEYSGLIDVAGLVSAIVGNNFYWWIDPIVAILVIARMTTKWRGRFHERRNPDPRLGHPAPPEFIQQLNQLASNHHRLILRIVSVRAYIIRDDQYYVAVQFELPDEIPVECACQIELSMQRVIRDLPDVQLVTAYCPQGRARLVFGRRE